MPRLFFALWPDEVTRRRLYKVARQFEHEHIRMVKRSNLHMTLEFLGEVADEDKQGLIDKASEIKNKPFSIELTRVGWWKQPQILYIGTTHVPKPLLSLVKSIRYCVKQQGLKPDNREYKPHVTIVRKARNIAVPKETFHIDWQVDSFALVLSNSTDDGVCYQVIQSWPLKTS